MPSSEIDALFENRRKRYAKQVKDREAWRRVGRHKWSAVLIALAFPKEVVAFGAALRKRRA